MQGDVGCWCLGCRELAVNGTVAVLQIGGDDLGFFFYHVVVPCWDCPTETVLNGGHNLFFSLENYFKIALFFLLVWGPAFLL